MTVLELSWEREPVPHRSRKRERQRLDREPVEILGSYFRVMWNSAVWIRHRGEPGIEPLLLFDRKLDAWVIHPDARATYQPLAGRCWSDILITSPD